MARKTALWLGCIRLRISVRDMFSVSGRIRVGVTISRHGVSEITRRLPDV